MLFSQAFISQLIVRGGIISKGEESSLVSTRMLLSASTHITL